MDTDALSASDNPYRASRQDGGYPRPQLVRRQWADLGGEWELRFDDSDEGLRDRWFSAPTTFDRTIIVPFPPESAASGINDTGFHPVVWYRRSITPPAAAGERTILHFGAVDYRCSVWLGGALLGHHQGGHTPFSFDVTDVFSGDEPHSLVVRAEDDPLDTGAQGERATSVEAVRVLESLVLGTRNLSGTVLRYGKLYGPGTWSETPSADIALHVHDAARAAFLAAERPEATGIFNVSEPDPQLNGERAARLLGWEPGFRFA